MKLTAFTFYMIGLINKLESLTELVMLLSGFALAIGFLLYVMNCEWLYDDEKALIKKSFKLIAIMIAISCLILVFIPSKSTLYSMLVVDNLDIGIEALKAGVDYVVNAMNSLK